MTLLADIVATSQRILETSSRRTKTTEIAGCLRHLDPEEIEIGVAFLSGETRQGRSGIGYASLRKARSPDAAQIPTLSLRDVDEALSKLAERAAPARRPRAHTSFRPCSRVRPPASRIFFSACSSASCDKVRSKD